MNATELNGGQIPIRGTTIKLASTVTPIGALTPIQRYHSRHLMALTLIQHYKFKSFRPLALIDKA